MFLGQTAKIASAALGKGELSPLVWAESLGSARRMEIPLLSQISACNTGDGCQPGSIHDPQGPLHPSERPASPWDTLKGRQHGPEQPRQTPCSSPSPELAPFFPLLFYLGREKAAAGCPGCQQEATGCPTNRFSRAGDRNTDLGQGEMWTCEHREMGCRGARGWAPRGGCACWARRCPAWLPPSPCVTLFARALSPALGAVTLPPAPGVPVAARPFSKHNTRERLALKSNRLFTPFTTAARVGLFLPGKRGGKKKGLNPMMSWDSGMWVRKLTKQRPGCQRRPPSQGGREPQEEEEGRTDPPPRTTQPKPRRHPSLPLPHSPEPLKPLFSPAHPLRAGSKADFGRQWGPRCRAAASQAPLGMVPRPAPGSVSAEEGVLPVSAEFLSVSPRACPWPFQAGMQLWSRSSPSDLQCAGRGEEDTAKDAWELILETRASRDVARATLRLGGRAESSCLHRLGQVRSGQGAQTSLRHCQQGKPSGVTEPEMIRILPEAGPASSLQRDHAEQSEHPGLRTNLPWEQQQRGGQSPRARGDSGLGLPDSTKAHPTSSQNNPQAAKRSNFFPKQLQAHCH